MRPSWIDAHGARWAGGRARSCQRRHPGWRRRPGRPPWAVVDETAPAPAPERKAGSQRMDGGHRRSFQKNVVSDGVPSGRRAWSGMIPAAVQPVAR